MAHLLTSSASEFIQTLGLESHFEGGYFKETEALRDGELSLLGFVERISQCGAKEDDMLVP